MADQLSTSEFPSPPSNLTGHAQEVGRKRIGAVTNVLHTVAGTDILVKEVAIYTREKLSQAGANLQTKFTDLEAKAKAGAISLAKKGAVLALSPLGAAEGMFNYIAETPSVIKHQLAVFNEKVLVHHEIKTKEKLTTALDSAVSARSRAQVERHHAAQALQKQDKLTIVRDIINNLK